MGERALDSLMFRAHHRTQPSSLSCKRHVGDLKALCHHVDAKLLSEQLSWS